MDPLVGGALVGGALEIAGGMMGNAASAREAKKNRLFQKKMYKHRYQYTVEDMRRAGLNPALAYQQGGGGSPSGATAQQDSPLGDAGGGIGRGIASALAVQQAKAQINATNAQAAKSVADTEYVRTQNTQLQKEGGPRLDWWSGRPLNEAARAGLTYQQVENTRLVNEFLSRSMEDRVSMAGLNKAEMEKVLQQMALDYELAGLQRAPLQVQSEWAKTWAGKNIAPAMGTAQGVFGMLQGVLMPFLNYLNRKGTGETKTNRPPSWGGPRRRW